MHRHERTLIQIRRVNGGLHWKRAESLVRTWPGEAPEALPGSPRLPVNEGDRLMIEYKGYTGVAEFDPDVRVFAGHVIDLRDEIYFEGTSVDDLISSMHRAVDHYLSVCRDRGEDPARPFSGNLHLRLGSDLHREASAAAAAAGKSLNSWITGAVEAALERTPASVRERAPRRS
jgi:predicted HicB family RNase H-like nuclease